MIDNFFEKLFQSYPRSNRFTGEFMCEYSGYKSVWQPDDTCSSCGSLHPEVLLERIERGDVEINGTDKSYKIYVRNRGGAPFKQTYRESGSPGGDDPSKWEWTTSETNDTKFYYPHFDEAQKQKYIELYNAKKMKFDEYGLGLYVTPYFAKREK